MILIIFVAIFTQQFHTTLLLMPLLCLPQLLLTSGLGYFTAALTVFLRDIPQTLHVVLNLWFYLTPIVYPVNTIPEAFQNWIFLAKSLGGLSGSLSRCDSSGTDPTLGGMGDRRSRCLDCLFGGIMVLP